MRKKTSLSEINLLSAGHLQRLNLLAQCVDSRGIVTAFFSAEHRQTSQ